MEGLRLITDVIEGPESTQGAGVQRERPAGASAAPPSHSPALPQALGPLARPHTLMGAMRVPTQGRRRQQTHGVPEEDEQLLQAGLAEELHVGVAEGE